LDKFGEKPNYSWRTLSPVIPNEEQRRWIMHNQIRRAKAWAKQRSAQQEA
jgi:hypothetical protein